jgi:hypothetical protein
VTAQQVVVRSHRVIAAGKWAKIACFGLKRLKMA